MQTQGEIHDFRQNSQKALSKIGQFILCFAVVPYTIKDLREYLIDIASLTVTLILIQNNIGQSHEISMGKYLERNSKK